MCQVFANVNTGGVSLTVFRLVTAIFAMDDFPNFLISLTGKLLCAIENVTGRTISGKDAEEVKQAFGAPLDE